MISVIEYQAKAAGLVEDDTYYYPSSVGVFIGDCYDLTMIVKASAVTGTLDAKFQTFDPGQQDWFDVASGAITQLADAGQQLKTVTSGFGSRVRVCAVIGTTSANFSVGLVGKQR